MTFAAFIPLAIVCDIVAEIAILRAEIVSILFENLMIFFSRLGNQISRAFFMNIYSYTNRRKKKRVLIFNELRAPNENTSFTTRPFLSNPLVRNPQEQSSVQLYITAYNNTRASSLLLRKTEHRIAIHSSSASSSQTVSPLTPFARLLVLVSINGRRSRREIRTIVRHEGEYKVYI